MPVQAKSTQWGAKKPQDAVCPIPYQLTQAGAKCSQTPVESLSIGLTVQQCCYFCFLVGEAVDPTYTNPFYFNYYSRLGEAICECVGATCTSVSAEGYNIYQTYAGVPVPPLPPLPTPAPTPAPSPNYGPLDPDTDVTVTELNNQAIPPPYVWNNRFENRPETNIELLPLTNAEQVKEAAGVANGSPEAANIDTMVNGGPYTTGLLMQTTTSASLATVGR